MSSHRLTFDHLRFRVLNVTGSDQRTYTDTKELLCKIPRFSYLEWLVEPAEHDEKDQIIQSEFKILNKFNRPDDWSKVIFEQLIPELLFYENISFDDLFHLHRAVHKIKGNYPEQFVCFMLDLKKWENENWVKQEILSVFIYEAKKILSAVKRSLEANKELMDALDDQILKWQNNFRQLLSNEKDHQAKNIKKKGSKKSAIESKKASHNRKMLLKVLLCEWIKKRGQQEAEYIFASSGDPRSSNWTEHIPHRVMSFFDDVLPNSYSIPKNEPNSRVKLHSLIDLLDKKTSLSKLMPQIMLYNRLFDDPTIACPIKESVQIKLNFLVQFNEFTRVWENKRSLACIGDLERFIEYYKGDCIGQNNLLDFILCNECNDDLKCLAFGKFLRYQKVQWQEIFQNPENVKNISKIIALGWADGNYFNHFYEDLKERLSDIVGRSNFYIETLVLKNKETKWLPFLEPDAIVDTLIKYKKDLTPWHNALVDMLRCGWEAEGNEFIARAYCHYWEYGFDNILTLRSDLTLLYWYRRYGGKSVKVLGWLQQEQIQEQLYNTCASTLGASEMKGMAELAVAYLWEVYRDRLANRIRLNLLKAGINLNQDILVDRSNFSYWLGELGYALIGVAEDTHEPIDRMQDTINRYPQRFEFETEVVIMPGVKYLFNLVKPGLVETKSGRVLVRAVIRPEIEDEEVLDTLFNELKNI